MAITVKERDAIAEALPQLLLDALGWTVETDYDDDIVEELANDLVATLRTYPQWQD